MNLRSKDKKYGSPIISSIQPLNALTLVPKKILIPSKNKEHLIENQQESLITLLQNEQKVKSVAQHLYQKSTENQYSRFKGLMK